MIVDTYYLSNVKLSHVVFACIILLIVGDVRAQGYRNDWIARGCSEIRLYPLR